MNKELQQEFDNQFKKMQEELKFNSSFDELEKIFFLRDFIEKEGFVSSRLSRQVLQRMMDLFRNWNGYLHSLMMPNPGSMMNVAESQLFSDEEKNKIIPFMDKCMELSSRNAKVALIKDKKEEAKLVDDSVEFWNKELEPKLNEIIITVNNYWKEKPPVK